MSEPTKPTIGKAILILVGWTLLACIASQLIGMFSSDNFSSVFVWVVVLLVAMSSYRNIRPMRYTFLFLALSPILFYVGLWLIVFIGTR